MIEGILQLTELMQVSLSIYFLFLLIKYHRKLLCIYIYSILVGLFAILKLGLLDIELGGGLNRMLWAIYNVGLYGFFIYLFIQIEWKKK